MESGLTTAQKATANGAEALRRAEEEREMAQVEANHLREEVKATEAKDRDADQEIAHLRKELEESRAGFAVQKKELENKYHRQVDDIFFVGYRCCIKKNDITQDTPSYLSDDEGEAVCSFA